MKLKPPHKHFCLWFLFLSLFFLFGFLWGHFEGFLAGQKMAINEYVFVTQTPTSTHLEFCSANNFGSCVNQVYNAWKPQPEIAGHCPVGSIEKLGMCVLNGSEEIAATSILEILQPGETKCYSGGGGIDWHEIPCASTPQIKTWSCTKITEPRVGRFQFSYSGLALPVQTYGTTTPESLGYSNCTEIDPKK